MSELCGVQHAFMPAVITAGVNDVCTPSKPYPVFFDIIDALYNDKNSVLYKNKNLSYFFLDPLSSPLHLVEENKSTEQWQEKAKEIPEHFAKEFKDIGKGDIPNVVEAKPADVVKGKPVVNSGLKGRYDLLGLYYKSVKFYEILPLFQYEITVKSRVIDEVILLTKIQSSGELKATHVRKFHYFLTCSSPFAPYPEASHNPSLTPFAFAREMFFMSKQPRDISMAEYIANRDYQAKILADREKVHQDMLNNRGPKNHVKFEYQHDLRLAEQLPNVTFEDIWALRSKPWHQKLLFNFDVLDPQLTFQLDLIKLSQGLYGALQLGVEMKTMSGVSAFFGGQKFGTGVAIPFAYSHDPSAQKPFRVQWGDHPTPSRTYPHVHVCLEGSTSFNTLEGNRKYSYGLTFSFNY